jgi:hypothetical protein
MSRKPKLPSPSQGDVVLVDWEDIHEDGTWQPAEVPEPRVCHCETVGFVGSIGPKYLVLVRTYGTTAGEKVAGDRITIPRGCITNITLLATKEGKLP